VAGARIGDAGPRGAGLQGCPVADAAGLVGRAGCPRRAPKALRAVGPAGRPLPAPAPAKGATMSDNITILGIPGSLRKASYNKAVLRATQALVPQGVTLETFELDGIPGFNQDEEKTPPPRVAELKSRVKAADAILFVTPEYNYSIPGVLKNAIDW